MKTIAENLPVIPQGMKRLWLSLTADKLPKNEIIDDTPWDDKYLTDDIDFKHAVTLSDMGYSSSEIAETGADCQSAIGIGDSARFLTNDGVAILKEICQKLVIKSNNSDWIISRRTRGAIQFSSFIDGMMRSPRFLGKLSHLVKVPLIPYPMLRARAQVNYFNASSVAPAADLQEKQEMAMWHRDGTAFVLNMLLSDADDFEGGNFLYYTKNSQQFSRNNINKNHVRRALLNKTGDTGFIAGTKVYHAVEPVIKGSRMSLILSFHCPYCDKDANEFWHLASDDGLFATIPEWFKLKEFLALKPQQQFGKFNVPIIEPKAFS